MTGRIAWNLLAAIAFAAMSPAEDKPAKKSDAEAIQGEWKITYFEEAGEIDPPEKFKSLRWTFSDGKFTIKVDGKVVVEGKYTLDPAKNPPHLDVRGRDESQTGIYKLDGDTLTVCASAFADNTKRPKEFKAPKGSDVMLIKFERVKK